MTDDNVQMELDFTQQPWQLHSAYPKSLTWERLPKNSAWLFIHQQQCVYISTHKEPPLWNGQGWMSNKHETSAGSYREIGTTPCAVVNQQSTLLAVPQQ